jgi:hypothetical protein
MSKSFEEFYESWMEEQLYMAGRLWEEEQFVLQDLKKQEVKTEKVEIHEYNQSLPWDIQKTDEGNDTAGPGVPFTIV